MKWFALQKKARGAGRTGWQHRSQWLFLPAVVFAIVLGASLLPKPASAADVPDPLYNIGQYCQKVDSLTASNKGGNCHHDKDDTHPDGGWEEITQDSLGCSGNMFYQGDVRTDHQDNSVHDTFWFVKAGAYKDCYNKALAAYNTVVDPNGKCQSMARDSSNWDDCVSLQGKLHDAIGCSDQMFSPTAGNGHWQPRPGVMDACKARLDVIGATRIKFVDSSGFGIALTDPISSDTVQADNNGGGGGGGPSNLDDGSLGCEGLANPLSWIICPAVGIMNGAISLTDKLITDQLSISTSAIFCTNASKASDSCQAYYSAWSSFRNISLGLLTIVGLVIVIAQAVGMEVLDAYTIRKTLPRLLVAAVAITLSWPLMNFAVTLSNNLGFGVHNLIIEPFKNLNGTVSVATDAGSILAGFVGFVIGGIAAVAALGILISYAATAGLAVLVAILVLVIRQIVVIAFIIISPIAILTYVLPNTQRVFRLWWESFSRALLMFPLIVAFIMAGRVFAGVALSNSQSLISQIIAFVAYFGPYFAIPLTFRMSGGIMSAAGNAINQRAQPGFGGLQKYRGAKAQQKWKKARANQLFNEDFGRFQFRGRDTGIAKMANKLAVNLTDQDEFLPFRLGKERTFTRGPLAGRTWKGVPGTRGYSQELQDKLDNAAISQSGKLLQEIKENGDMHYEGWRGVAGDISSYKGSITRQGADGSIETVPVSQALSEAGFSEATPPSDINDFRRMAHILQQSDNDKERKGGHDLEDHAGTLAAAKRGEDMEYADTQIAGMIALGSAGRIEHEPAAKIGNALKKRINHGVAGRAMNATQSAASRTERPDMRDGHAFIRNAKGEWESVFSDANYHSQTAYGNIMSVKGQAWSGAKAEAVQAAHKTIVAIAKGQPSDGSDSIDPLDVQSVHEMIEQGIRNPYNDAGQRAAWRKVAEDAEIELPDNIRTYTADEARQLGLEQPPAQEPPPEPQQQQQ